MRVLILNQFVPPSHAPTAKLAGDLAAGLLAAGHDVRCIGSSSSYAAARGLRRLTRDLTAHLRIAWAVLTAGRCDWIVAFSDPTGLPVTAWILSRLKSARLAHWAMDVYPQTAIALGAVQDGSLTRLMAAAMHRAYRGCRLLVALDRDMMSEIAAHSRRPVAILPPWPPELAGPARQPPHRPGRIWLYSGNLGRAHEYETLLRAQQILEQRGADWQLCFQGGGSARTHAERIAADLALKNCHWSGYVPEEEFLSSLIQADVLIATQRPETRGLLWPSKLSLMRHLGIPIAWVGPTDGAVAQALQALPVACGLFPAGSATALADWLMRLPARSPGSPAAALEAAIRSERSAGVQWWLQRLGASPDKGADQV